MIIEKPTSFKIKTVSTFWYNCIFLFTCFFIGVGLMLTFQPGNAFTVIALYGITLIIAFILAGFAKNNAIIYIDNEHIILEQSNSLVTKGKDISIPLGNLRGFEVGEITTRYDTSLVLYQKDFTAYRYRLSNASTSADLKVFLTQYIPLLTAKTNPNYSSFTKAFWVALKNILILCIFTGLIWFALSYFISVTNNLKLASIGFIIPLLFWFFITRKRFKQNFFRYAATTPLMLAFPFIAMLLFFPVINKTKELISKPLSIKNPKEIYANPKATFLYIQNIQGDKSKVISSYTAKQASRKSRLFRVEHYIETQEISKNGDFNNIWLRKTVSQNINKSTSPEGKKILIANYANRATEEFRHLLNKKAVFYKVITVKQQKYPLVVLEPFWTSLDDYKKEIGQELSYLTIGIIALILIGSLLITTNR